jgi:hypothetical protein
MKQLSKNWLLTLGRYCQNSINTQLIFIFSVFCRRERLYVFTSNLRTYEIQPVFLCHFLSSSCHHSDHQWKYINASMMRKFIGWTVTQHNLILTLTCYQKKNLILVIVSYFTILILSTDVSLMVIWWCWICRDILDKHTENRFQQIDSTLRHSKVNRIVNTITLTRLVLINRE